MSRIEDQANYYKNLHLRDRSIQAVVHVENKDDEGFWDGLTPENAYLHIQGHQLYKLIVNIGSLLCKGKRVAFRSEIIDFDFPISGYEEIDSVQADLRTILM